MTDFSSLPSALKSCHNLCLWVPLPAPFPLLISPRHQIFASSFRPHFWSPLFCSVPVSTQIAHPNPCSGFRLARHYSCSCSTYLAVFVCLSHWILWKCGLLWQNSLPPHHLPCIDDRLRILLQRKSGAVLPDSDGNQWLRCDDAMLRPLHYS